MLAMLAHSHQSVKSRQTMGNNTIGIICSEDEHLSADHGLAAGGGMPVEAEFGVVVAEAGAAGMTGAFGYIAALDMAGSQ